MFKLLRHFSLVSACAIVVMVAVLMLFFRHLSVEDMINLGERQNEIVAHAISNHIGAQFGPLADLVDKPDGVAAPGNAIADKVSAGLQMQISNLPVLKVSIVSPDGLVIVSSNREEIGKAREKDAVFLRALAGELASKRIPPADDSQPGGSSEDHEILSSFLPLENAAGTVVGVFEIDADLTLLLEDIDKHVLHVFLALLIALVVLYFVLYRVVRRADRTIKNQHAELQRSTDMLLQSVMDGMADLVCVKDFDGRYLFVNRVFEEWCKTTREQAIGKTDHDYFPRAIADRMSQGECRIPETGKFDSYDTELTFPDGENRLVAVNRFSVSRDNGSVAARVLVGRDITELKRTQESLQQAQKMEAVGQLTGGVAHDFNNLLMIIMGNAQLLEEQVGSDSNTLAAILQAAERGGELTHRLLAFSRQQSLQPRAIDLVALTAGMSKLLTRTFGETIEVRTSAEPGLWTAQADPGQLENALLNLGLNARDAMPGGGKLTISCANERLDADSRAQDLEAVAGDYVVLAVSDNGTGMPADVRAQAFEPFFTTKEVGEGSGLGLSMVYGFAKQSGGHVSIYSEEGHGTTVKIYLPRAEQASPRDDFDSSSDTPQGVGETVLVIEDDSDVRDLARRMLEGLGYRVIVVDNAKKAEKALADGHAIDLVLSDVVLPGGVSGPAFAETVRVTHPDLTVVFMSGYPAESARHNGILPSDKILLTKPFNRQKLAKALHEALQ